MTAKIKSYGRDGPLEKLWGGEGNFRAARIFFVFRTKREYFLELIGVHEFFSFNFLLREYFFCASSNPPPPPSTPISFLMVRPLGPWNGEAEWVQSLGKTPSDWRTLGIIFYQYYAWNLAGCPCSSLLRHNLIKFTYQREPITLRS